MENAQWVLQKAIYQALKTSPALVARLGERIYDDIPRKTRYPYLRFGQCVQSDYSSSTEYGSEHRITLHVWSSLNSRQQVLEIMDTVNQLLDDQTLQMGDHHLVNMRCEFRRVSRDSVSQSFHGVLRFRVVSEVL